MFVEVFADSPPHGVEYHVDALAAREFGSRHAVGIGSHQDDPINKAFERKRCDIESNSHIDAFLSHIVLHIVLC